MIFQINKGTHSYINKKKKQLAIITLLNFVIILVLYLTGYLINDTRNNMLTLVAILYALPTAKFVVSLLMLVPYSSIMDRDYEEAVTHSGSAVLLTELILTTDKKVFSVPFVVVADANICGYVDQQQYDTAFIEKYLTDNLKKNGEKVFVKILSDKKQFLSRADTLSDMAKHQNENKDNKDKDKRVSDLLLTLSL